MLILGTIVFIFANSMLSKETSGNVSGIVGELIGTIIPPDTDLGKLLLDNLRKIAHFTEYGFLGILIAIYVIVFCEHELLCALYSIPTPFVIGFLDESIQIVSKRGPSVSDVWIDIGGFCFFSLISYTVYVAALFAVKFFRNRKLKNK